MSNNTDVSYQSRRRLGTYKLLSIPCVGGFGKVYLGEHVHLHTRAAVKLHHAFGETVALDRVVSYAKQIATGLQHIQNLGIVHCDVKPENIFVGNNGEVLIGDFGIAIAHQEENEWSENILGTVAYMAPEQILGHPRPESDQYALAVVVYEWLTGQLPFGGVGTYQLLHTLGEVLKWDAVNIVRDADPIEQHTLIQEKAPQHVVNGVGGIRNNGHIIAGSPFFNIFYYHYFGLLEPEEARDLITIPAKLAGLRFTMLVYEWLICLRPFFLKWEEINSQDYDAPSSKSKPMTLQQDGELAFKEWYEPDQTLEQYGQYTAGLVRQGTLCTSKRTGEIYYAYENR